MERLPPLPPYLSESGFLHNMERKRKKKVKRAHRICSSDISGAECFGRVFQLLGIPGVVFFDLIVNRFTINGLRRKIDILL